ncbi:lamin tail domain-containing protein [Verrucomicrobia bacterium]|nr:lamin tail domain-containing protein [Verrucomicrobiota bacterium]
MLNKSVLISFVTCFVSVTSLADRVKDTKFSVDRGFFEDPFLLEISSGTEASMIRFTTDGSKPSLNNGQTYFNPILINTTTVIRAMAFKEGYKPTNIDTQSYFFLGDVIRQNGDGMPQSWGSLGNFDTLPGDLKPGPYLGDYEMDQEVVNDPKYSQRIVEDLKSIPTLSLSLNPEDLFSTEPVTRDVDNKVLETRGIYPIGKGFERSASAEMILEDGTTAFQIDCSLEVQGASSTERWKTDKLSMRLKFKSPYGPNELDYPLFGDDATDNINTVILDATNQQSWTHPDPSQQGRAQFIRDQFVSDLQNAAGGIAPRGSYAFVYLNGLFWGLYWLHEFIDENYAVAYRGGKKKDYDILRHRSNNIVSGDNVSYNSLLNLIERDMSNDENYASAIATLDLNSFIDYILVNFYAGNKDWAFQNWNASYNKSDPNSLWLFHNWDAEKTFQLVGDDVTDADDLGAPTHIHQRLKENAQYRLKFADRAHRLMFDSGVLTPEVVSTMYLSRLDAIDRAVVAESARWGDNRNPDNPAYTREDWLLEKGRLMTEFFPERTRVLLNQLREDKLYPELDAPVFSKHGGAVENGFNLKIENPSNRGEIFYTINGKDPRSISGAVSDDALTNQFLTITESLRIKGRTFDQSTGQWSALTEVIFSVASASSNIRVSEIMFHPSSVNEKESLAGFVDQDEFEFIEITNNSDASVNIKGLEFTKGIKFQFDDKVIEPRSSIVITNDIDAFNFRYEADNIDIAGEYDGSLSNSGEIIQLSGPFGNIIQDFYYDDDWYSQPDGEGRSLVPVREITMTESWSLRKSWRPSNLDGGSPGYIEGDPPSLRITEIHFNPAKANDNEIASGFFDRDQFEFVELRNVGDEAIQIKDYHLSGAVDFVFGDYELEPGKYLVVASDVNAFHKRYGQIENLIGPFNNGKLNDSGERILLLSESGELIHNFKYSASWHEESDGQGASLEVVDDLAGLHEWRYRYQWGASSFAGGTPGNTRVLPTDSPIRISELMYNPRDPSNEERVEGFIDNDDFEFIELINISKDSYNLEGYELLGAVRMRFGDITLSSGQRVLVVNRLTAFQMRYGDLPNIVGEYSGNLNNESERIILRNSSGSTVLDYTYSGNWYDLTDGNGHSLTVINPFNQSVYFGNKGSWRPSRNSGGSPGNKPDPYFDWVWRNFSDSASFDLGTSGELRDPDVDGMSNVFEYATSSDPSINELKYFLLPVEIKGENHLLFTYNVNLNANDVQVSLEYSTNLRDWSDASSVMDPYILKFNDDETKQITVITKDPTSSLESKYFRLVVSKF